MKSVIVYYKKTITINETELEKKNVVRIILSKGIQRNAECLCSVCSEYPCIHLCKTIQPMKPINIYKIEM